MDMFGFDFRRFTRWQGVHGRNERKMDQGVPTISEDLHFRAASVADPGGKIQLAYWSMQNRSGGVNTLGIGGRFRLKDWVFGTWTHATTTFVDDTANAQDVNLSTVPLDTTTINDGFIIGCKDPFNVLSILVDTAGTGTVPTYAVEYNRADGWASVATVLADIYVPPPAAAHFLEEETLIWWDAPPDWVKGSAGALLGTGLPSGMFFIRVRATTPPGTAATLAASMSVAVTPFVAEGVVDDGMLEGNIGVVPYPLPDRCEGLVTVWSVPATGNHMTAIVRGAGGRH